MDAKGQFGVALVGCGIVGGGTARVLTEDITYLQERTGIPLYLKYVVDRDYSNARSIGIPEDLYEEDYNKVLTDPDIFLVVELIRWAHSCQEDDDQGFGSRQTCCDGQQGPDGSLRTRAFCPGAERKSDHWL